MSKKEEALEQDQKIQEMTRQALIEQVSALSLQQMSQKNIAKHFKTTEWKVRKLMGSDDYKEYLNRLTEECTSDAKVYLKTRTREAAPKVWDAMMYLIKSDSGKDKSEGIKHFLRVIGYDSGPDTTGSNNIQILMPGAKLDQTVETETIDVPTGGNDVSEE